VNHRYEWGVCALVPPPVQQEDHVAGWPSIDRADDQRLAQSLYAGDATALPEIYDAYAPRLFDYCHVLLRDQEGAALALHDSLITAQERIGTLPDARLFRGWLYSVTRNECLRRRAYADPPAERRRAPEAAGLEADEATRQLVHAALLVLNGPQREALDLSLRHELDPHELAEVLGVSPHDASVRVAQARHDLDDAFAAVVVAATGRDDCPSVAALAGPVDAPLDADTCAKLARHISNCPICGTRGNRKVATARLLNAMPTAAIPDALRSRVLSTASAPELADLRATIAMRAEPLSAPEPEPEEERAAPRLWPVFAGVACVMVIVAAVFLMMPGSGQQKTSGEAPIASPSDSSSFSSTDPDPSDSAQPSPSDGSGSPTPKPSKSSKTPTPGASSKRPGAGRQQPPPAQPQGPGTLSVSGCHMNGSQHCSVRVTAKGGPVGWRVSGTDGSISASGSGSLSAGHSASVQVTRHDSICLSGGSGSVSFSSGAKASVTWSC
jgi:RNA polymerase sigma factor (sigma-70 family)